jgi:FemAB-related protein (PEP-CTERM system-associated)
VQSPRLRRTSRKKKTVNPSTQILAPIHKEEGSVPNPVKICAFDAAVAEKWDNFVLNHPEGTFFHLTKWKNVIEKTFGYKSFYFYAEREGRITAIAPLFLVENWVIGRCIHSAPYSAYAGICAADETSESALLDYVKRFAVDQESGYLELHQRNSPLFPDFHHNPLYVTFTTELSANVEANWKKLPRDTRYMVRKGEKSGLKTQHGFEQMDSFYVLFSESMRRLGTPVFPKSFFENLVSEFGAQVDLMVVLADSQPVSAVMSFFFRDTILPYFAGASAAAPRLAANNFMYWKLMTLAAERGFRFFDFGRSKRNTGAFAFKSQWGMTAEPLNYQVYLVRRKTVPNFSPVNPKFEMAARLWRRLPRSLAKSMGPRIVRWFP